MAAEKPKPYTPAEFAVEFSMEPETVLKARLHATVKALDTERSQREAAEARVETFGKMLEGAGGEHAKTLARAEVAEKALAEERETSSALEARRAALFEESQKAWAIAEKRRLPVAAAEARVAQLEAALERIRDRVGTSGIEADWAQAALTGDENATFRDHLAALTPPKTGESET